VIRLGPGGTSGLGYVEGLNEIKRLGLNALEVEFTYGVRMKKEEAAAIGKLAKKQDISLSIHAPYYINLCSDEKEKVVASKQRIIESCDRAVLLGAGYVVFHAGFYQKKTPEDTYELIKEQILELNDTIKSNNWKVMLAPETTGKGSQFGSLAELLKLKEETKCHMTVDFAHLKARLQGKIDYDDVMKEIKSIGHVHSHFSGIEWTQKGEKRHIITTEEVLLPLLSSIVKHKLDVTIINESPDPFSDSVKAKNILHKI
jgi:deoxyribonuclease IV